MSSPETAPDSYEAELFGEFGANLIKAIRSYKVQPIAHYLVIVRVIIMPHFGLSNAKFKAAGHVVDDLELAEKRPGT